MPTFENTLDALSALYERETGTPAVFENDLEAWQALYDAQDDAESLVFGNVVEALAALRTLQGGEEVTAGENYAAALEGIYLGMTGGAASFENVIEGLQALHDADSPLVWTPNDFATPANISLWLEARQGVYSDSGVTPAAVNDLVRRIVDARGSIFGDQATSAKRPVLRLGSDGKRELDFDTSDDTYILTGAGAVLRNTPRFHVFSRASFVLGATRTNFFATVNGGTGARFSGPRADALDQINIAGRVTESPPNYSITDGVHFGMLRTYRVYVDLPAGTGSIYRDGEHEITGSLGATAAATPNTDSTTVVLSGNTAGTNVGMRFRGLIVVKGSLTDAEVNLFREYINRL